MRRKELLREKFKTMEELSNFIQALEKKSKKTNYFFNNSFCLRDMLNNIEMVDFLIRNFEIIKFYDLMVYFNRLVVLFKDSGEEDFEKWFKNTEFKRISKSQNGFFYKTTTPFEEIENEEEIIYISEYSLLDLKTLTRGLSMFDLNEARKRKIGNTLKELREMCENDLSEMKTIFEEADWQDFASLYFEYNF